MVSTKTVGLFEQAILSPEIFDIATALRGPDIDGEKLKLLFTARIRSLCGLDDYSDVAKTYLTREEPEIPDYVIMDAIDEAGENDVSHFLSHVMAAIESMTTINRSSKKAVFGSTRELTFLYRLAQLIGDGLDYDDIAEEMTSGFSRYVCV